MIDVDAARMMVTRPFADRLHCGAIGDSHADAVALSPGPSRTGSIAAAAADERRTP